ncbi:MULTISPECIES: universal stress protein [unclassified Pseudomonas]|uniref:universal stress protein n=1 Tax=Pseudomonas TaxID=286 RepID=UPI0011A18B13|nr:MULTISPECIES: universal stress protein [unclassified Pseudomonas]TWC23269.1 universal stress protein E [Pseudomonas sp. SJZ083]TWC49277.1 universal stress protein E [Pseudomonas sp. SJZ077]
MSQYQRLLLIINPALRHSPAINHAAALAKASGAGLHIAALVKPLEILSLLDEGVQEKARESYLQDHRDWLKNQATNLNALGLKVTTEVMWADDMKQDILDHVTEMQPDLLIKEVQHESALKRAFFTPLDWHLLRHCPIPVYLVGGGGHALPRKVVAAVDASDTAPADSELNERIIQQATNLALQCDAELHLLYACDLSGVYLADMGGLALPDITKELRTTEEQSFSKLAGRYGVPSDRRHFVLGHPVAALSDFANEQQVDVIVMGRVQYHGLEKLLGSTTEHILYQVPCSVLAV